MAGLNEFGLTIKQLAFADKYIENGGDATGAYLFAYPNTKKEATAASAGSRLLRNVKINAYLEEKTKMTLAERGLVSRNAINHLIDLAMGTETTSRSTTYDHLWGELVQDNTYTNSAPPKVQTEAMALLMKHLGLDVTNSDVLRERMELENERLRILNRQLLAEVVDDQDDVDDGFLEALNLEGEKLWDE